MSETLVNVRDRVRYAIDDRDPENFAVSTLRLNMIIERNAIDLGARLLTSPGSASAVTPYVNITLVQGTYDYRIGAATDQNAAIRQVQRVSDGYWLRPRSLEYINWKYRQDTDQASGQGPPVDYAMWEEQTAISGANSTRMRLGPTPEAAGTLRVYRELTVGTVSAMTADSDPVPFGQHALRILEMMAAIECVAGMPNDVLQERKLSPTLIGLWQQRVEKGIRDENWRRRVVNGQTQAAILRVRA